MLLNSHKRIVLISDGRIEEGAIIKPRGPDEYIETFKYDIHDFFGDMRGMTREGQFHLASIMLSINNDMKITSI